MLRFGKVTDKVAMKREIKDIKSIPKKKALPFDDVRKDTYRLTTIPVGSSLLISDDDISVLKLQSRVSGIAARLKKLYHVRFVVTLDPKKETSLRVWRVK